MSNNSLKIDFDSFLTITGDENYYSTPQQISRKNIRYFTDNSSPSRLSGIDQVIGLFNQKSTYDNYEVYNSKSHAVTSVVIDSAGNSRKILSPEVDYFSSSSLDAYKNGVEITKNSHWTAGLVKVTAGTPGHLRDNTFFGVNDLDIISENTYYEIDVFDPVSFLVRGRKAFTYPIVTSDVNQLENTILNGIIEPFPIRPVISNFSINFPFEPQGTRGQFGIGNINWRGSTDSVVSIDEFLPQKENKTFFLDAADVKKITTGTGDATGSHAVGPPDGYFNLEENILTFFEDKVNGRGETPNPAYDNVLLSVINTMTRSLSTETYVSSKKKSYTCGFDCEYSDQGTDSVAYKNSAWNPRNRDNRRQRQTIISLRDSESFVNLGTKFDDTSIIFFNSGSNLKMIEYPAMLPLELTGSVLTNPTVRSELFKSGSIRVLRGVESGLYETPLADSVLSAKRRTGTL